MITTALKVQGGVHTREGSEDAYQRISVESSLSPPSGETSVEYAGMAIGVDSGTNELDGRSLEGVQFDLYSDG